MNIINELHKYLFSDKVLNATSRVLVKTEDLVCQKKFLNILEIKTKYEVFERNILNLKKTLTDKDRRVIYDIGCCYEKAQGTLGEDVGGDIFSAVLTLIIYILTDKNGNFNCDYFSYKSKYGEIIQCEIEKKLLQVELGFDFNKSVPFTIESIINQAITIVVPIFYKEFACHYYVENICTNALSCVKDKGKDNFVPIYQTTKFYFDEFDKLEGWMPLSEIYRLGFLKKDYTDGKMYGINDYEFNYSIYETITKDGVIVHVYMTDGNFLVYGIIDFVKETYTQSVFYWDDYRNRNSIQDASDIGFNMFYKVYKRYCRDIKDLKRVTCGIEYDRKSTKRNNEGLLTKVIYIKSFKRRLPEGFNRSEEKTKQALKFQFKLEDNETFVEEFYKDQHYKLLIEDTIRID